MQHICPADKHLLFNLKLLLPTAVDNGAGCEINVPGSTWQIHLHPKAQSITKWVSGCKFGGARWSKSFGMSWHVDCDPVCVCQHLHHPHWCWCGWMGANLCQQVPKMMWKVRREQWKLLQRQINSYSYELKHPCTSELLVHAWPIFYRGGSVGTFDPTFYSKREQQLVQNRIAFFARGLLERITTESKET